MRIGKAGVQREATLLEAGTDTRSLGRKRVSFVSYRVAVLLTL